MLGKEESENHCEMEARFERPVAAVNNEGEMRFILNIFVVNVFIKVYISNFSFLNILIIEVYLERCEFGGGVGSDISDCSDWNL